MTNELAPCYDERRKNCLMNSDNRCNGLMDTNFKHHPCPFFKDKRELTLIQVEAYREGCEEGFVNYSAIMKVKEGIE